MAAWKLKKLIFIPLVFIAVSVLAEGPRYQHNDTFVQQEVENIYQDIRSARNLTNGRILQIQSFTTETSSSSILATFRPSNLTLSITPTSSSSKIFVAASARIQNGAIQTDSCYFTLARNGTNLGGVLGFHALEFGSATNLAAVPMAITYLDSPATTSATTYDVRMKNSLGGVSCMVGGTTSKQSIVLVEIGQ